MVVIFLLDQWQYRQQQQRILGPQDLTSLFLLLSRHLF